MIRPGRALRSTAALRGPRVPRSTLQGQARRADPAGVRAERRGRDPGGASAVAALFQDLEGTLLEQVGRCAEASADREEVDVEEDHDGREASAQELQGFGAC